MPCSSLTSLIDQKRESRVMKNIREARERRARGESPWNIKTENVNLRQEKE